jgi:hypothetical protein
MANRFRYATKPGSRQETPLRRPGARLLESLEFGGFVGDRAALPKIPFRIDLCKWLDLFVCAMRGSAAHKQMFLGA